MSPNRDVVYCDFKFLFKLTAAWSALKRDATREKEKKTDCKYVSLVSNIQCVVRSVVL